MTAPFNAANYPKFNTVADPRRSPTKEPGQHFWVRLTDTDRYVSCLWCGELLPTDTAASNCTGKPRLDILNAPLAVEHATPVTLSTPTDPNAHITTEHATA